jgi:hypothetical protein
MFFLGVIGAVAGVIGLCLRNCVKTKCNNVELCFGFFKIERDIGAEIRAETRALELGVGGTTPTLPNSSFSLNTPQRPRNNV